MRRPSETKSAPILSRQLLPVFLCLLFFLTTTLAEAQRPRIGVTLSGGGAKGLAHLGILKAIDSAGLKVDFVTGTSVTVDGGYAASAATPTNRRMGKRWDVLRLYKVTANCRL